MPQNKSAFLAAIGQPAGGKSRNLKYHPSCCVLICNLARQGEFPEVWAAEIGVSLETIRLWSHRYPDFRDAMIMAKHLLAAFWTQDIARNRNNPTARTGLYQMLARRLPALYGRDPVDLTDWLLEAESPVDTGAEMSLEQIRAAPTEVLEARVAELLRRRQVCLDR